MADNFDTLSIQITASATKAINAVNKLADALGRLNGALNGIDSSNLESASQAANRMASSITRINTRRVREVARSYAEIGQAQANVAQATEATEQLADAQNRVADASQRAAQSAGNQGASGFQRFRDVLSSIAGHAKNAFSAFGKISSALSKIAPHSHKAASGMKKLGKSSSSTAISAKKLVKELTRVGKMLKLMVTRMALRAVIKEVGNGFKSLALHSEEFNASMSSMINGSKKLSYSFAAMVSPLINALAPALVYIINLLIKFINIVNQVFSALSGSNTWNRAKDFTDSWADSINDANSSAKQLKKTVLGFDELNQLQDNNSSGGGSNNDIADMFDTVEVAQKWKDLAKKIKDYWLKFLAPIKKAWAKAGDYVKDSWLHAFESVKNLLSDIADDFIEVWNQPATVRMLENILKIVGNIGQFIGNLADSFDRAWNKADVGKRILEKIRDIAAIIVEHIEKITASWAEWAAELDFTPLLEQIDKWLESLKKPVDFLMGVFEDFNKDFLQPLAKWAVEKGGKQLLQVFEDFNNNVDWDLLRDRLDEVWKALEHFSEEAGKGIIQFLDDISASLSEGLNSDAFGNFVDMLVYFVNNVDADEVERGLKLIAGGLLAFKAVEFLNSFSATGGFILFLGELSAVISAAKKDIEEWSNFIESKGGLLNAIFDRNEYAQSKASNPYTNGEVASWTKTVGEALDKLNDEIGKWIINNQIGFALFFKNILVSLIAFAKKAYDEYVKLKANIEIKIGEFQTKVKGKLAEIKESVRDFFNGVKAFFNKDNWTFSGVADGLRDTFSSAKNAIKNIWNGIADSLNGSFTVGSHTFSIGLPKIYASGGFPEDGLFMANHNELVGKFSNGRTAVANNEQITEGIARAVYSAMVSANGSGSGQHYINNTIQIDGKTLARAVTVGQDKLNRLYSPTMA